MRLPEKGSRAHTRLARGTIALVASLGLLLFAVVWYWDKEEAPPAGQPSAERLEETASRNRPDKDARVADTLPPSLDKGAVVTDLIGDLGLPEGDELIAARIEREQVAPLRSESLTDILDNLSNVDMYYWPGGWYASEYITSRSPLVASVGIHDVSTVLSNRRWLKIQQDLRSVNPEKAAAVLSEKLESALGIYRTVFEEYLAEGRGKKRFQISSNPDGSPTLRGAKLGLLSLVLLAADLESRGASPAVLMVAEEAHKQRERICSSDLSEFEKYVDLDGASLYSRQMLGTGLVATAGQERRAAFELPDRPLKWRTVDLPHYDAEWTPFDIPVRSSGLEPDFSKGRITIRFLADLSDSDFDRILQVARSQ